MLNLNGINFRIFKDGVRNKQFEKKYVRTYRNKKTVDATHLSPRLPPALSAKNSFSPADRVVFIGGREIII